MFNIHTQSPGFADGCLSKENVKESDARVSEQVAPQLRRGQLSTLSQMPRLQDFYTVRKNFQDVRSVRISDADQMRRLHDTILEKGHVLPKIVPEQLQSRDTAPGRILSPADFEC
jgi:hypothetical protein